MVGARYGAFGGFRKEALGFLADLSENNDKQWFDLNRETYEREIVGPALRLVEDLGKPLRQIAPTVRPEPRIGGSLFRIYRDTRFSDDKRPYKTHVGIRWRDAKNCISSKCSGPLFYVQFDSQTLRLGVGVKQFDGRTLEAYRRLLSTPRGRSDVAKPLKEMTTLAESRGEEILGDLLSRPPGRIESQSESDLLRRKGLFVRATLPLPWEIYEAEFVTYCLRWFKPYAPLFHALHKVARAGFASAEEE